MKSGDRIIVEKKNFTEADPPTKTVDRIHEPVYKVLFWFNAL